MMSDALCDTNVFADVTPPGRAIADAHGSDMVLITEP